MVRLNLGCGRDIKPTASGWINIDKVPYPGIDQVADLRDVRMIQANSVDEVYCKSVLEHFPLNQVPLVLKEMVRMLKPGCGGHIITTCLEGLGQAIVSKNFPWTEINKWMYARDVDLERHHAFFSIPGLQQLVRDAGLVVDDGYQDDKCIWGQHVFFHK